MAETLGVMLHAYLQGETFVSTRTEAVPKCVRTVWDWPTAPVCHTTSKQKTGKAA